MLATSRSLSVPGKQGAALENSLSLDGFLQDVQARAFRMAQLATRNEQDALDIVQDAMFKLVEKYAGHESHEWKPLFYRILHSRINDFHRRNNVRNRYRVWLGGSDDDADSLQEDRIQTAPDQHGRTPEQLNATLQGLNDLQSALEALPFRQQQAFLLRVWEGLDVRETAQVMECAEGSVKTHYSRAIHSLREQLGEHWP